MDLTTPAVLFPAISLLLLAFTNRFLGLAQVIRSLHEKHRAQPDELIVAQIGSLRRRVRLIRSMQTLGVLSLILCTVCIFLIFVQQLRIAEYVFGASLVLMVGSLTLSLWEIHISVHALDLQLRDLEGKP
ncbi:DUF2721 domain-containing protein [Anatilimnocola floriformis]|uniref:DUF2721 domain-containing protein n=1 Tax=Anatilimnocola floriformis TaxID=2948575 RepID=UPI0020C4AC5B|nr:DUF2721 domain-containing protein [Anatilimnocola floriformis]